MLRAVFFDVGGTLIHTDPRTWLPPVLARFGAKADWRRLPQAAREAYAFYEAHHLAARDREAAIALWREFDRRLLAGLGVKNPERIADWLVEHWRDPGLWPRTPGTPEVLAELCRRGLRLAAVSNWDVLLPEILAAMGLAGYFERIYASAALGVPKPDPAIYQRALAELGLRPEEVLFVGDRPEPDYEAPKRLGMRALLVRPEEGILPVLKAL